MVTRPEELPVARRPRIAILGTGGTISFTASGAFDVVDYGETGRVMPVAEVLQRAPALAELAELVAIDVAGVGSDAVTPATWLELRTRITDLLAEDQSLSGVVVTHGTATLEETAYFLHLTLPTRKPVVLVGAQRPSGVLSSDAEMNLAAAIRLAGSELAEALGVTVVMNDEVHSARDVTKASVHRLHAFEARALGPLGQVEPDGSIALYRAPLRLHTVGSRFAEPASLAGVEELPRVDITYSYAGMDGTAVRAFVDAGARGIVAAAFAPGLTTPAEEEALVAARARGVAVVVATRAGSGRVLRREIDREHGFVVADDLTPQKARVLAMLALVANDDPDVLQELYATH